ncbi:WxPxxD family membrane protein [Bacillus sp. NEB1478]|uniref:WxPxxD family membrane protein n=1 Tax=Bacillus sp. NEB1478 TaxID=3073816 RepID=UPI0028738D04|nr:WxPxxD family membrane protein [Bacillus sp. NEB1478]WNB92539.1 WxPxxD family membrane protein [Bacillus sp. NEB1478]
MTGKRIISIFGIILFFIIVWFITNSRYIGASTVQSLIIMNNSAFGYNSLKAFTLFYPVPFLFFLNYFFLFEKSYTLIRQPREKLYIQFVFKILIMALLFSFIQMVINDLLSAIFMDSQLLADNQFFLISLLQMVVLTVYLVWMGIFYRWIYDVSNSSTLAIFVTYLFLGCLYFAGLLLIPANMWDPIKELNIFQPLLEQEKTLSAVWLTVGKQVMLAVMFYLVGSSIFLKKDILTND